MMERTDKYDQTSELGGVSWYRDLSEAMEVSALTKKPVFLLFQEVPGCSTCVSFGKELLSYPLLVETIEHEFIPLVIYNNVEGKDLSVLKRFGEKAWNNPVVRFIDPNGVDIVEKINNPWNPFLLIDQIINCLNTAVGEIPEYVELIRDEFKVKYGMSRVTYYETPCFWSGETSMMQHPAVLTTEAGWVNGKEVVKVHYDPTIDSLDNIDTYARDQGFFLITVEDNYQKDVNPQYYLKGTIYGLLPLSLTQRSRLNYVIPYKKNSDAILSPGQLDFLDHYRKTNQIGVEKYDYKIENSWPMSLGEVKTSRNKQLKKE